MSNLTEQLKKIHDEIAPKAAAMESASAEAIVSPFPGPLRDVFALDPDVQVGPYKVRACYDYDIRVLFLAKHPVYDMIIEGNAQAKFIPLLGDGHLLAWMFTRPAKDIKLNIETHGLENCRALADDEFQFQQPRVVMAICNAAVDQITLSLQARLSYKTADESSEGKGTAQASAPPPHPPLTASGG